MRAATRSEQPQTEVRRIGVFRDDGHIRTLQDIEAEVFAIAVRSTGSVAEASRQLGVSRNTIYRRGK
jgi:transcriptional regulator of acetoin/glycerol metabolism